MQSVTLSLPVVLFVLKTHNGDGRHLRPREIVERRCFEDSMKKEMEKVRMEEPEEAGRLVTSASG